MTTKILLLLTVAAFSTGCGLKGDLYLEEETPAEELQEAEVTPVGEAEAVE